MVQSPTFQHTRYVLINRLATPLGAFGLLVVIGRQSDTLLGEYALVMTFYYVMQMLPLLGLTPYLAREVARRPERAGRYFSSIGMLSIGGCVCVDLLCFAFLGAVDYAPHIRRAILVTGVLIFPGILLFIAEVIFMSLHRARPAAHIAVAENLSRVALSIAALGFGGGLEELIWVFFATRLCAFIAYLVQMKRTGIVDRFVAPDREVLRETLHVLPAFLGGAVLFVVFSRMDFLVLSIYEKVEAIGYYAVGYRPYEICIILLTALIMAVFPWISRRFVAARIHFRVAVKGLILLFAGGLAFASLGGILLADTYVYVLFRNQHPHPVLLTQLFMAGLVVAGMDYVTSSLLHASDRQGADARAMAVGAIFNLTLLFWLVPLYGIYGALLAKLGATLVQCVQKLYFIDKLVGPLWQPGESRRFLLAFAAVGVTALVFIDTSLVARLTVVVVAGLLLPALMLVLGLFQPLRLLRFYWHGRAAGDVTSVAELIDVIVADARHRSREMRRVTGRLATSDQRMDRAFAGVILARVARHLYLRGRTIAADRVSRLNRMVFRVWVDPACMIGPGWTVHRNADVRLNARIGAGLMCAGDARVGPAPGLTSSATVGDGVTLLPGAQASDGCHIPSGSVYGCDSADGPVSTSHTRS